MMASSSPYPRRSRWLVLAIVLVAALGALHTLWTAQRTELWMRAELQQQARSIADAINPERLAALTGTADDVDTPAYLRLKQQLGRMRQAYPDSRFLYLMGRDPEGRVFFFVDSEPSGSADESPAGQIYEEATDNTHRVFSAGTPFVSAPFADRWGTWISALTPITNPETGRVIAVLGMDIDATHWRHMIRRELLVPLGFTLAFMLILAFGRVLLNRRERLSGEPGFLLRHAEALMIAACGLTLTLMLAHEFATLEQRTQQHTFTRLVEGSTARVIDALHDVRDYHLDGLGHVLATRPELSEAEFRFHTRHLIRSTVARIWAWAPAETATSGHRNFPIRYAVPAGGAHDVIGYDPGTDPTRRVALETAIRTGMPTATDLVPLIGAARDRAGLVVFHAVFGASGPSRLLGLALTVLRPDLILERHIGRLDPEELPLTLSLYQLGGNQPPVLLGSTAAEPPEDRIFNTVSPHPRSITTLVPVMVFGKAYAFIARPTPLFADRYPQRAFGITLLAGTLITLILAAFIGFLGNRRWVLERHVRERTAELRNNHELLNKLSAQVPGVIYQFLLRPDGSSCFPYSSAAIEAVYGVGADTVREDSNPVFRRVHSGDRPNVFRSIRESAETLAPWRAEYRVIMPDRTLRWCEGHAAPERLPDGGTLWHGFMTDITERKKLEAELTALATTDPLTGLPNRRSFLIRLGQEFERLQRFGEPNIAILMFDLDHFKRVNDTHGHAVGDDVLRHFSGLLKRSLRKTDLAGRLGGEEFAVMLVGSSLANAHRFAARIRELMVEEPFRLAEISLPVTVSIGITLLDTGDANPDIAISRADTGLYRAKQSGRDRAEVELPGN